MVPTQEDIDELSRLHAEKARLEGELSALKFKIADEKRNLRNITDAVQAMHERHKRMSLGKMYTG